MDAQSVLSTLASIAVSLVGFAGLMTAFRASNETLQPNDVSNIRILLIFGVSAMVLALLPIPFMAAPSRWLWPGLSVLMGAFLLFWVVQSRLWMRRKGLKPRRPRLFYGMIGVTGVVGIAVAAAGLTIPSAGALYYVIGVLWCLILAVVAFVVQIFAMLPIETR